MTDVAREGAAATATPDSGDDDGSPSLRERGASLLRNHPLLLEVFIAFNLLGLVADIAIAHQPTGFAEWTEWVPLVYALVGGVALAVNLGVSAPVREGRDFHRGPGRALGLLVGSAGIVVGVAGLVLHLESNFFQVLTLKSLVYSAPFVGPLAFAGLGFLLVMNRTVDPISEEWSRWVLFLALGGFFGNFAISLADHAQNGFFYASEWIPVIVGAGGFGYLITLFLRPPTPGYIAVGWWVLAAQVVTGLVGVGFHLHPLMEAGSGTLMNRVVYGPPPFPPFLFVDLALLAGIGLWDLKSKLGVS